MHLRIKFAEQRAMSSVNGFEDVGKAMKMYMDCRKFRDHCLWRR